MGSTTERVKTSAIVIAYLASFLVVAAAPSAVAPTDSTPETTVAQSHANADVEHDLRDNVTTKGEPVEVDTLYDEFRVFNISGGPDNVTLHAPDVNAESAWTGSGAAFEVTDTGADPDAAGQEARFFDVEFDRVGWWNITAWNDNDSQTTSDDTVANKTQIFVEPLFDIDVTVEPVERDFPGNRTVPVRVVATWSDNGTAVENANISIINSLDHDIVPPANSATDSDGKLSISRNFWRKLERGADDYEVRAVWPNQSNPKRQGVTDMTVNPADARLVDTDGLPVTHGFTSEASWDVKFPTNDPLESSHLLRNDHLTNGNLSYWNVTHLEDGNPVEWLNVSGGAAPFTSATGNITVDANGTIFIEERWNNTDHAIRVIAEQSGNISQHEYELDTDFDAQAPAAVNLRVDPDNGVVPGRDLGPADGDSLTWSGGLCDIDDPSAQPIDNCRPTGSEDEGTGNLIDDGDTDFLQNTWSSGLGEYELTILGDDETHVPEAGNLSISVDGPHVGTPVFTNETGTELSSLGDQTPVTNGTVLVRNITPARGDSELTFNVDWEDQGEASIVTEIKGDDRGGSGDVMTVDTDEVTVGEETDVTFHIEDIHGNAIPEANLEVFWEKNGTDVARIGGNGSAGHGGGGDYVVTVWVNGSIGDLVAHANDTQDRHAYAELEIVPAHDLDVDISPDEDLAGRNTEYTINVTRNGDAFDGTNDDVDVFVMNDDQWDDFQENGSTALTGFPASTTPATTRDSEGNFTFDWRAAEGTYHVYVRTTDKLHDNVGQVPTIEEHPADISWDPEVLVSQVDTDVTVSVHLHDPTIDDHDDSELNGTLALRTGAPGGSEPLRNASFGNNSDTTISVATDTGGVRAPVDVNGTIDVTNGDGHIDNVSALRPGPVYAFFDDPDTDTVFALSSEPLEVQPPNVEITPDLICVGVTTQVVVTVTHPLTDDPIEDADIRLKGGGLAATVNGTTNANGVARLTVFAQSSNQVNVTVNGDLATTFTPANCMTINFDQQSYTAGDPVTVTIVQAGSTSQQVPGATVLLDGTSVGMTGQDGSLTFEAPSAGDHLVRAKKTGFADATAEFTTEPATQPSQFEVTGISVEDAETYLVDSTYTVTGTVENSGGVSGTVTVQFEVEGAVTDSTQLTLDAGQSQQVAFQWTPSQTGDITVTVSADGSQRSQTVTVEEEEPTVPGFEIVAVLAALGAAAVAMRRRD